MDSRDWSSDVCSSDLESRGIRLENLTIQNGSQNRAQAVALHLDGTENIIINCNLIGNQDTVFTGNEKGRFLFTSCYIEGTTDYIFGPATCWFEECTLFSKENSYITAASTPSDNEYGYIFNNCRLKGKEDISVFLGRPWRPYAYTLFINCEMDSVIKPQGWHNWGKQDNERTSRYLEYNNSGPGSSISERTKWSKVLSEEEAAMIKREVIFPDLKSWNGNQ